MMMVKNTDDTNFVEIGYDDTGFKNVVKILPGDAALFQLAQGTPQAKADTDACVIQYFIVEA